MAVTLRQEHYGNILIDRRSVSTVRRGPFATLVKPSSAYVMWNFLWHMRGNAPLDESLSDEAVLERVADLLEAQRQPIVRRDDSSIAFKRPSRDSVSYKYNWLAMAAYQEGRFWIERLPQGRILRYDLVSFQTFRSCSLAGLMFFCFGISMSVKTGLGFAAFAFGWLYGMNMLLAWLRVPTAIRKAIAAR